MDRTLQFAPVDSVSTSWARRRGRPCPGHGTISGGARPVFSLQMEIQSRRCRQGASDMVPWILSTDCACMRMRSAAQGVGRRTMGARCSPHPTHLPPHVTTSPLTTLPPPPGRAGHSSPDPTTPTHTDVRRWKNVLIIYSLRLR